MKTCKETARKVNKETCLSLSGIFECSSLKVTCLTLACLFARRFTLFILLRWNQNEAKRVRKKNSHTKRNKKTGLVGQHRTCWTQFYREFFHARSRKRTKRRSLRVGKKSRKKFSRRVLLSGRFQSKTFQFAFDFWCEKIKIKSSNCRPGGWKLLKQSNWFLEMTWNF